MPGSYRPTSAPSHRCQALSWGRNCSVHQINKFRQLGSTAYQTAQMVWDAFKHMGASAKELGELAEAFGTHTVAQDPDHEMIAFLAQAEGPRLRCTSANLERARQIAAKVLNRTVEVVEDEFCPPDRVYAIDAAAMRFPPLSEWPQSDPFLAENTPFPHLKYQFDWSVYKNDDSSRKC